MAVDGDGLRELNELYSLPKNCFPANFRFACGSVEVPITSQLINKGVVRIPEKTRAMYLGRRFILPGGRLVEPYAANRLDMARDGAVEVERIRITQPPTEGLEGWVDISFLRRVCCGL
jgi:hypothetical protein